MRNSTTVSIVIAALVSVAGLDPARADDARKNAVHRLEDRISEINNATKKPEQMKLAMDRISTETGVPVERIHNMHKDHENAGAAGLMLACVMADETKKPPAPFLDKHVSGKSWEAIADDNHVSLDTLSARLDRLQRVLNEGKKPQ